MICYSTKRKASFFFCVCKPKRKSKISNIETVPFLFCFSQSSISALCYQPSLYTYTVGLRRQPSFHCKLFFLFEFSVHYVQANTKLASRELTSSFQFFLT
jgi:hypothetical protein